jgi:hypothetical protein
MLHLGNLDYALRQLRVGRLDVGDWSAPGFEDT